MSTAVLPSLAGLGWGIQRTPVWETITQTAISGKEVRIAKQTYPRWKWELTFNVLRSASAYTEFQQLAGFFNARQGSFDTFLYQDADDNAVIGQTIGTGNAGTTAFQLVRSFGGFAEPVLAPNTISNLYLSGTAMPSAGISAPATPVLSQPSGGSLGAATYYVRTTYVTGAGETATSPESSLSVSASHLLQVASPAAATCATGYNVYVSTATATETRQNSVPIAIGTAWLEPTSGLINTGASFPVTNLTGWSVSSWGTSTPGIIAFVSAPGNTVPITADFSYYWPCRMSDDSLPFSLMFSQFYDAKKFSFISVKN